MTWNTNNIPDQRQKTVIITGANCGIGFESARILAKKGALVILACRDPDKGGQAVTRILQEIPAATVINEQLDLADLACIRSFARTFLTNHQRLHCLINNAGVMVPPYGKTKDGFETQFGTNHLGHFALTGLVLPALIHTQQSRVIHVSSLSHHGRTIDFDNLNAEQSYSAFKAYGQSKLANLLFAFELHRRLHKNALPTISLAAHPGFTKSNLQRYSRITRLTLPLLAQSSAAGALPLIYAATAPELKGGEYIGPSKLGELRGMPKHARVNPRAQELRTAAQLWDISAQMTGVSYLQSESPV